MFNNYFPYDGDTFHKFATSLWPLNRSITGEGVRRTLKAIGEEVPILEIKKYKSGKDVFDWQIPNEWNVNYAYIIDPSGKKICDFEFNNLHLVGYSESVEIDLNLEKLQQHLYSLPDQPNAIPYITSYYEKRWGFCISHQQRTNLLEGTYKIRISTTLTKGTLDIGEIYIPGKSNKEIFISTYTCHPSMANNEISGITVSTYLAKYLASLSNLRYSYRFVFVPETIGSITYLHDNLKSMKKLVVAGFNLSCIGDDRNYSYLPSRDGNTLSDVVAIHVLEHNYSGYKKYSWLDRGSDERQYCAPGIDLPIASLMRTKYGEYPEYHTSLDDLTNVVTPTGLEGGFNLVREVIEAIEQNILIKTEILGEPMMSKHQLYPTLSVKNSTPKTRFRMNIISYSDGNRSLVEIANILDKPIFEVFSEAQLLINAGIVQILGED